MLRKWSFEKVDKIGFAGFRFFSGLNCFEHSQGNQALQAIFRTMSQDRHSILKQQILVNHLKAAWTNQYRSNTLAFRDARLPGNLSLSEKINQALQLRLQYFANPVLTSHPTEVLSEETLSDINDLVKEILSKDGFELLSIAKKVEFLCGKSWLPDTPLSPHGEIKRQDKLYLDMMQDFSSFHEENARLFARHHGIGLLEAKKSLLAANQFAFQHVSSWAVADIDGNKKRDRQSMEIMEKGLQLAIIERYMLHMKPLLQACPSLMAAYHYLERCRRALNDGIFFNIEGAWVAKQRLIQELNKTILEDKPKDDLRHKIEDLQEFVDIVGFRGALKQFVRQSSKANAEVFNNFVTILVGHYPEINLLAGGNKHYKYWSESSKRQLHHLLRTDSCYFRHLRDKENHFLSDTVRELDILDFVYDYRDQFDYILSDTQSYTSLDEVIILFAFSRYRQNRLVIDEIKRPPVNLIPLCETPEDLTRLSEILDHMLRNPYLKQVIIQKQELIYVAGPSDLGKEGGLFAHVNLIEAEKIAQNVLSYHQKLDANLKPVKLRVLYGLGGDMHRRVAEASAQLFSTFQGAEACAIGAPFAFKAHVERVTGEPSENTLRANELSFIEAKDKQAYTQLKKMVAQCIEDYRQYIAHPASRELFKRLTISEEIGRMTNTSSRAESKSTKAQDINSSRAIGITNYDLASPLMTRIIMSADGLTHLSKEVLAYLPGLFQNSVTVQEQVLKILFALSVADENRAWHKLLGKRPSASDIDLWANLFKTHEADDNPLYALAYVHRQIPEILKSLMYFLPPKFSYLAQLKCEELLLESRNYQDVTLKILTFLGQDYPLFRKLKDEVENDLRPRYCVLAELIDEYHAIFSSAPEAQLSQLRESIVLALRGDRRVAQGPLCIAELQSPLRENYQQDFSKNIVMMH